MLRLQRLLCRRAQFRPWQRYGERRGGIAEWANISGASSLPRSPSATKVLGAVYDAFSTAPGGWDYTNLTAIGTTCAIARVLGLDAGQTREALAMTVIPHFASDEIESGELNARGDLTMWKRFNGADAVRNSLQACLLASVGVEGAVRPFVGKLGFIQKLANNNDDAIRVLRAKLDAKRPLARVCDTYFKRWPVGSLAQSAIQAALQAPGKGGRHRAHQTDSRVRRGRCLRASRQDPQGPLASNFTRDRRSLAALHRRCGSARRLHVRTDSFDLGRVLEPVRQRFLAEKVTVSAAPELGTLADGKLKCAQAGYLSRVEIETIDGKIEQGDAAPFPGHPKNPYSDHDLTEKLRENMRPFAPDPATERLVAFLNSIDCKSSVRDLTRTTRV